MNDVGKILVIIGLALVILGGLIILGGKANLPLGRLPGDIRVERDNFKFYFPLTTCLLISAVLTLVMWLLRRR
jgi:formate hydrogenlyase subunit 3/multisubunit Na+/H+ antiporter MnhD subunit